MEVKPLATIRSSLRRLVAKEVRGRIASRLLFVLLVAVIAVQGFFLRQALRSPNPAEWNSYSAEANEHLYDGADVVSPEPMAVVAHGGGGLPGMRRTNSLEALDYNYAQGHRLFELDLAWTADDELVAMHDWDEYQQPGGKLGEAPTLEAFVSQKSGPATPATLFSVYQWLERHPAAFIVTDAKEESLRGLAKIRMERPELVHRFIPQIYLLKDYDLAASQGYRHIILTLYRCLDWASDDAIVGFAKEHQLFAVTMPIDRCVKSDLAGRLREIGVPVYAHTVNDADVLAKVTASGASGVYSDVFTPLEVAERRTGQPSTVLR